MSSNAITIPRTQIETRPWVDELHQWLATVDHKRLGILYIVSALLFLAVGGGEAFILLFFFFFFFFFCFFVLFVSFFSWCAGHGFSALECLQLLAVVSGRAPSL